MFFVNTTDEHRFYIDLASKQQAGEIFQRMKISTLVRLVCLRNLLFNKQKKNFSFKIIQVAEINALDTPKNAEFGMIFYCDLFFYFFENLFI